MSLDPVNVAVMLAITLGLVFSAVVGGRYERTGAAIIGGAVALTQFVQFASDVVDPKAAFLLVDAALGVALLLLFVQSNYRVWVAVAGCGQAALIIASAVRFFDYPLEGRGYLIALIVVSFTVHVALWAGAWAHRWGPRLEDDPWLGADKGRPSTPISG